RDLERALQELRGVAVPALTETGSLPRPLTPLIGREADVGELAASLTRSALVTLIGPGGAGKTRVAVEATRRVAGHYPHGVHFVGLADVGGPAHVAQAVAGALGVAETPGLTAAAALATWCQGRRTLLVL